MWEYMAALLVGFWFGVAILLYVTFYWLEEIFDLPASRDDGVSGNSAARSGVSTGASGAHAQLKRLVARVVEEAAALPALARYAEEPPQCSNVEASTYEDLLATAILNKVIERYQTENGSGGRSSGIHSASASPTPSERSSPRSRLSRDRQRDVTPSLRDDEDDASDWDEGEVTDDALEIPRRVPFPEFGGDIVHTREDNDQDFDETSISDIQAADGSWEENWLFQKKKIKTLQSVPVPMLVPNSNTDYRVLIGDRDADDTTDLSDNASDAENDDTDVKSDMKRVLDSKNIIGGGKPNITDILDFEPDSLTSLDGVMDFDSLDGTPSIDNEKVIDAINNEIDKPITEEANLKEVSALNESILVVGIDSGPLHKTEFSVEEIHRTNINGKLDDLVDELEQNKQKEEVHKDNKNSLEPLVKDNVSYKGSTNTLNGHEKEREYEETVTLPVQRYADSLRRRHFDDVQMIPTRDTDDSPEDDLIPGSIADRERKKWLNYVEMPNNPYSPEAIQKRLSAKSNSAIFDILTKKGQDLPEVDDKSEINNDKDRNNINDSNNNKQHIIINGVKENESKSRSPSPRILKEALAEDIPEFKRYGRDYYIKEAKKSSGSRKRSNFSDTSSVSSLTKSISLENETEFASPVSASSSLSDLEAAALHQNIVRVVLSPRNASPNFAINPIFEYNDTVNNQNNVDAFPESKKANVRHDNRTVCNGGVGFVENEDIGRLNIPKQPEVTEDLFESYTNVRRNNTLRSDDLYVRSKRRPGLNYTFGGSLRLSKNFQNDLW